MLPWSGTSTEAWKLLGEGWLLHLSWWDGQDISAITHPYPSLFGWGTKSLVKCHFFTSVTPISQIWVNKDLNISLWISALMKSETEKLFEGVRALKQNSPHIALITCSAAASPVSLLFLSFHLWITCEKIQHYLAAAHSEQREYPPVWTMCVQGQQADQLHCISLLLAKGQGGYKVRGWQAG